MKHPFLHQIATAIFVFIGATVNTHATPSFIQGERIDGWYIERFRASDDKYLSLGRNRINDLSQRHFGSSFHGEKSHDLDLLQRLWDEGFVTDDKPRTLQDMGIILGDLFAKELDMHWVLYTDTKGRSRALQLRHTEHFLFPITMISRRAIAGAKIDISAIYDKAMTYILPHMDDYSSYRRRILPINGHLN